MADYRELCDRLRDGPLGTSSMEEAADAIEALVAEVENYKRTLQKAIQNSHDWESRAAEAEKALEKAVTACDSIGTKWWRMYKGYDGYTGPNRANTYAEGYSDGAHCCMVSIEALRAEGSGNG
jgi:hypothetical protein